MGELDRHSSPRSSSNSVLVIRPKTTEQKFTMADIPLQQPNFEEMAAGLNNVSVGFQVAAIGLRNVADNILKLSNTSSAHRLAIANNSAQIANLVDETIAFKKEMNDLREEMKSFRDEMKAMREEMNSEFEAVATEMSVDAR